MSTRWTPETIYRRDSETGAFEVVNPRDLSKDEERLQRALITEPDSTWRKHDVAIYVIAVIAAILGFFGLL